MLKEGPASRPREHKAISYDVLIGKSYSLKVISERERGDYFLNFSVIIRLLVGEREGRARDGGKSSNPIGRSVNFYKVGSKL